MIYPMNDDEYAYCYTPGFSVNILVLSRELEISPIILENAILYGHDVGIFNKVLKRALPNLRSKTDVEADRRFGQPHYGHGEAS